MVQDSITYYVWIGGSCDYGHKERAGGAAVVIEHKGSIISRDVISDLHTTEFRMMLTLMVKVMNELPDGSDILFLTNAAYIQNFDKTPTAKSANPDLISQCIEAKTRHNSVVSKSYSTIRVHCSSKHMTWQQKLWQRQEKNTTMTSNEQALFAMMQELGYSHGLCITALQILSQNRLAISDMLAFLYEEQPSEETFIKEIARICETYHLNNQ